MNALTKALEEITAKQIPNKSFNLYVGAESFDLFWDIAGPHEINLHGIKQIATNLYEAIVFDDISQYNKFNLVVYSNSAELKPPMCIELDDFQRVTDTLVRFTVNYTYPLERSTWKLEGYR